MKNHKEMPSRPPEPLYGPISLLLPLLVFAVGFFVVAGASGGVGGDLAGPVYLGYAVIVYCIVGIVGFTAGIIAIKKHEQWIATAVIGLAINLALTLPAVAFALGFVLKHL